MYFIVYNFHLCFCYCCCCCFARLWMVLMLRADRATASLHWLCWTPYHCWSVHARVVSFSCGPVTPARTLVITFEGGKDGGGREGEGGMEGGREGGKKTNIPSFYWATASVGVFWDRFGQHGEVLANVWSYSYSITAVGGNHCCYYIYDCVVLQCATYYMYCT